MMGFLYIYGNIKYIMKSYLTVVVILLLFNTSCKVSQAAWTHEHIIQVQPLTMSAAIIASLLWVTISVILQLQYRLYPRK